MGVMRFRVEPASLLDDWPEFDRSYISGFDGRVFPCRHERNGPMVACRRQVTDSGMFHVGWPVRGFGRPVLTTSSLAEREAPYLLPVELARGKLSQLRDQVAVWSQAGLQVSDEFWSLYRQAHRHFSAAACGQDQPETASAEAQHSLEFTLAAERLLTETYSTLRLQVRSHRTATLPVALGCQLGRGIPEGEAGQQFTRAFTAAMLPVEWRAIEPTEGDYHWQLNDDQAAWARERRLHICGGPLLDFSPGAMPGWLRNWDHDFFNLQSFVCDFVETAISRYIGTIRFWEVAARSNIGGGLRLSEDNRLNLTARALEVARAVDEEIQLTVRITHPWSDYQHRGQHRLTAWQHVDALLRMGAQLSAINLEFAVGFVPDGDDERGLLDLSQILDQWSQLGLPLFITLACPSRSGRDPLARPEWRVREHPDTWTPERQAAWIDSHLPVILAKQSVVNVYWCHYSDAVPHDFPHAGVLDETGTPKPAYTTLTDFRDRYWNPTKSS